MPWFPSCEGFGRDVAGKRLYGYPDSLPAMDIIPIGRHPQWEIGLAVDQFKELRDNYDGNENE
jgi:hypothetical protein